MSVLGRASTNIGFNGIEFTDAAENLSGNWRPGGLLNIIELSPRVSPAGRQHNITARRQLLKPGISINLQDTTELLQVSRWSLRFAVRTVEVNSSRRIQPAPWPIISRIDP